jgi:hypothetical protein
MSKKTISNETYTACIGVMYLALNHAKEAEVARTTIATLLAEELHQPGEGKMLAELKNEYGDYVSDEIWGANASSSDVVASVESLLTRLGVDREVPAKR